MLKNVGNNTNINKVFSILSLTMHQSDDKIIIKDRYKGEHKLKQQIATDKAPAAIGPYSQGMQAGNLVITSGQLPIDPATGAFPEGIEAQTHQSLANCKAVLQAAGLDLSHVVKTTVFLSDMNNFAAMNNVYATFFQEACPARSAVEVARLPKDALVEIECIAVK